MQASTFYQSNPATEAVPAQETGHAEGMSSLADSLDGTMFGSQEVFALWTSCCRLFGSMLLDFLRF